MNVPYRVIRSDRRTLALEVTRDGELLVRAPRRLSEKRIRSFVEEQRGWIEAHYRPLPPCIPFTAEEITVLKERARAALLPRVDEWARRMDVDYSGVTVRMQRTKWGSCSAKRHLNLNAVLVLCPPWITDYVIVHELAHCYELNHSTRFWNVVKAYFPSYKEAQLWLKEEGEVLSRRIPKRDS